MRICILSSGSSGNATLLVAGETRVLIDCGLSGQKTLKRLQEVGEDPAKLDAVVVTHEHGDHVAGVVRGDDVNQLAPKTILTRTQVDSLLTNPQMPEIKLTLAQAARYNVVDYEKYMPYGPGVALIKSPGHTPGSQMVYVALESGREYLFIGDATWHMDGVRQLKGKDAPWITENKDQVMAQLQWLNELGRTEKNLYVIASHDDEQHKDLIAKKTLGGKLE